MPLSARRAAAYDAAVEDLLGLWPLTGYELGAYMKATFIPAVATAYHKARGKTP